MKTPDLPPEALHRMVDLVTEVTAKLPPPRPGHPGFSGARVSYHGGRYLLLSLHVASGEPQDPGYPVMFLYLDVEMFGVSVGDCHPTRDSNDPQASTTFHGADEVISFVHNRWPDTMAKVEAAYRAQMEREANFRKQHN